MAVAHPRFLFLLFCCFKYACSPPPDQAPLQYQSKPANRDNSEAASSGITRTASPSRYARAVASEREAEVLAKRHLFEFMTPEMRESFRQEVLERAKTCESNQQEGVVPGVQVSMLYTGGLSFCKDCADAHETGSFISTWESHYGPMHYHISGQLIYSVPNTGQSPILNTEQAEGRVVLVDRGGGIPLVEKVLSSQVAGALAVIIVDDGTCKENFDCGSQGFKQLLPEQGFSWRDRREAWDDIYIPSVLVSNSDGARLKQLLDLETIEILGHGPQLVLRNSSNVL